MTVLPVVRSVRANQDIEQATAHYFTEGGAEVALRFLEALERASALLASHLLIGSPRFGHALNIPGLRHRKLHRYPWVVLYLAHPYRIEVVRVLDARCDIPATLGDDLEE